MKNILENIKNLDNDAPIGCSRVIPFKKSVVVITAVMLAILLYAIILGQKNFLGVFFQVTVFSILASALSGRMRNSVLPCSIILAFGVLIQLTLGMSPLKLQLDILLASVTAAVAAVIYKTNVAKLNKRIGVIIMVAAILGLTALAMISGGIGGASNWILIGGISIQATELTKLIYIICLCTVTEHNKETELKSFIAACILTLGMAGIYILQNEFGTLLLILIVFMSVVFLSYSTKYTLYTLAVSLLLAFVGIGIAWIIHSSGIRNGIFGIISSAYEKIFDRIVYWLNPEQDIYNKGYQYIQRKQIILTTGLFGTETTTTVGIKESDLVLTAVMERFGVILSVLLMFLYTFAFWQQITASHKVCDGYHKKIIAAMSVSIAAQVIVIAAYTCGAMPITGLCLPFIGRGGTAMMTVFMMYGIMSAAAHKNIWDSGHGGAGIWNDTSDTSSRNKGKSTAKPASIKCASLLSKAKKRKISKTEDIELNDSTKEDGQNEGEN